MCVSMSEYMYMFVSACRLYICVSVCMNACTCIYVGYVCLSIYLFVCICMCIHVSVHVWGGLCVSMCPCVYVCVTLCAFDMHENVSVCVLMSIFWCLCFCVHVCCVHACINIAFSLFLVS